MWVGALSVGRRPLRELGEIPMGKQPVSDIEVERAWHTCQVMGIPVPMVGTHGPGVIKGEAAI